MKAIRLVDIDGERQAKNRSLLYQLGYQPKESSVLLSTPYLYFNGIFNDQSEIKGYVDLGSWLTTVMPEVEGIDWLSVDEKLLPSLISSHPLAITLNDQHTAFTELRIIDCVKEISHLKALLSLGSNVGPVLIEKIFPGNVHHFLNLNAHSNLSVPLIFCLGSSFLSVAALRTIEVGDVLLIERTTNHVHSHNKELFQFELNQESIMIVANANASAEDIPENEPTVCGLEGGVGIDTLPVELCFVLLQKTVTLGELKAMIPGEKLPLPPDQLLDVDIRANQQRFARGELVQLSNGQLAVEIHKIWV